MTRTACLPLALLLAASAAAQTTPLQQDDCALSARDIVVGAGTWNIDTSFATTGTAGQNEGLCNIALEVGLSYDIWFTYVATVSGSTTISLCGPAGTMPDSKMAVYPGGPQQPACPTTGTAIACNDQACGNAAEVTFTATAGQAYLVQVGAYPVAPPGSEQVEVTESGAPTGPVFNPFNGHHYQVLSGAADWEDARTIAEGLSFQGVQGHLATLSCVDEDNFVQGLVGTGQVAFLGGFQDTNSPAYQEPSGGWEWVNGEPWQYTNWAPGEPNDAGGENYLSTFFDRNWNDAYSTWAAAFVVEFDTPPSGLFSHVPRFNPVNGHYYRVVPDNGLCYTNARDAAAGMVFCGVNGHLATITNQQEQDFLDEMLAGYGGWSWIGAFQDTGAPDYAEPDGGWSWITGEPWSFTNWAAGEPDNLSCELDVGANYIRMGFGAWHDDHVCNCLGTAYIVEWEPGGANLGTSSCEGISNSTGQPAVMEMTGTGSAGDPLTARVYNGPESQFGYCLVAATTGAGVTPGNSQGVLCLTADIGRYRTSEYLFQFQNGISKVASGIGDIVLITDPVPVNPAVTVLPGETWYFQAWYRDFNPNLTNNFSNVVGVTFQ